MNTVSAQHTATSAKAIAGQEIVLFFAAKEVITTKERQYGNRINRKKDL